MSHRAFLSSWWPFSGYSGSKSRSGSALSGNILHFTVRAFLFYLVFFILWVLIHSFYETIVWFFAVKASQFFGLLPFSRPEVINGKFACWLKTGSFYYVNPWVVTPTTICITMPMLLSSSGISLSNRVKMVLIALSLLFVFHVLYVFIDIHGIVYRKYPLWVQRGTGIEQIITYSPAKDALFSWLHSFFNTILKFPAAVGIWIGLVSYYKKSDGQHWIRRLF